MDIFNLLKSISNFTKDNGSLFLSYFLRCYIWLVYDMIKTPYYETSATVTSDYPISKE